MTISEEFYLKEVNDLNKAKESDSGYVMIMTLFSTMFFLELSLLNMQAEVSFLDGDLILNYETQTLSKVFSKINRYETNPPSNIQNKWIENYDSTGGRNEVNLTNQFQSDKNSFISQKSNNSVSSDCKRKIKLVNKFYITKLIKNGEVLNRTKISQKITVSKYYSLLYTYGSKSLLKSLLISYNKNSIDRTDYSTITLYKTVRYYSFVIISITTIISNVSTLSLNYFYSNIYKILTGISTTVPAKTVTTSIYSSNSKARFNGLFLCKNFNNLTHSVQIY